MSFYFTKAAGYSIPVSEIRYCKHTNGLSCLSYSRGHLIYLDIKSLSPEYIFYIVKTARRRISDLDSNGCFRNKTEYSGNIYRKN